MAVCNVQDLMNVSRCFACLPAGQLEILKTSLLCQILKDRNPMASCDVSSLLSAANCFSCLGSGQLAIIQTQLLCEILNAGGGGGGEGCIVCGNADPVDAPTCDCALAYNRVNGSFWYWDNVALVWQPLIQ